MYNMYSSFYLMCSANQIKVMFMQEFGDNLSTKCERHSSIIFTPTHCILKKKRHLCINKNECNKQNHNKENDKE